MLNHALALALFVAVVFALATMTPGAGARAALIVEEKPWDSVDGINELGYCFAALVCTMMLPCRLPILRGCQCAWRRARTALPSTAISITLLSGKMVRLPVRLPVQAARLAQDKIQSMRNVISGARDAERRARHAKAREAREARYLRDTRAWFNEHFGSWQRRLNVSSAAWLAAALLLGMADPIGHALLGTGNIFSQTPTPSQFNTAPYASPWTHSTHIAEDNENRRQGGLQKLMSLGPSFFEPYVATIRPIGAPLPCAHHSNCCVRSSAALRLQKP